MLKQLIRGAAASTTMRANGTVGVISLIVWALEKFQTTDMGSGAETGAIVAGILAVFNLYQRCRTKKPLSERAK